MTKESNCYRCQKNLIKNGVPKEDFTTDTIMTGKKKDKPLRRLICNECLKLLRTTT